MRSFRGKKLLFVLKAVLIVCCMVFVVQQTQTVTYAYTKEEIEAAKAWLSGHGYSPDAGGAAQAYQDYLNGKLGGNGTEQTDTNAQVPANPQDSSSQMESEQAEGAEENSSSESGQTDESTSQASDAASQDDSSETETASEESEKDDTTTDDKQVSQNGTDDDFEMLQGFIEEVIGNPDMISANDIEAMEETEKDNKPKEDKWLVSGNEVEPETVDQSTRNQIAIILAVFAGGILLGAFIVYFVKKKR